MVKENVTDTFMTRLIVRGEQGDRLHCRRFRITLPDRRTVTTSSTVIVGSSSAADVQLTDDTVSRVHLRLAPHRDGLRLVDLDSRNGTFVDSLRIGDALLTRGAAIRLGSSTIQLDFEEDFDEIGIEQRTHFGELLGHSPAMRRVFHRLRQFAGNDAPVLLLGETGTGKGLAAEAVHGEGARRDGPFVVLDCASLPMTLIESELFGHCRGAFTGATVDRPGVFETAHGGTVFLDEIGELDLSMQVRLLRVVETGVVRRIGEQVDRHANCRIIAATHRDLARMVSRGDFREDLYYRLNVLVAEMPPLRERSEDIPLLAGHFAQLATLKYPGARPEVLTAERNRELMERGWPGNARELRNFVERLVLLGPRSLDVSNSLAIADAPTLAEVPFQEAREVAIQRFERAYVTDALRRSGGNVAAAARAAGVHRGYLFRLIRRYGLKR